MRCVKTQNENAECGQHPRSDVSVVARLLVAPHEAVRVRDPLQVVESDPPSALGDDLEDLPYVDLSQEILRKMRRCPRNVKPLLHA